MSAQHHERQDGSGYHDGLTGLHTLQRSRGERLNHSITVLLGDIAAAAALLTS